RSGERVVDPGHALPVLVPPNMLYGRYLDPVAEVGGLGGVLRTGRAAPPPHCRRRCDQGYKEDDSGARHGKHLGGMISTRGLSCRPRTAPSGSVPQWINTRCPESM